MSVTAGSRLGPYEITGVVGAGGMGEVFRGKDARLGRDVAIKVLPTLFAADPDRLRRFEQEARAAAALNHPNILVVYDVGADAGMTYVVSELLDGQTLRQTLDRGTLPMRKAIDYGTQIANGLAAAHEKGIVHRDLKPENVFVTKDGRVKILDFGLAKLAEAATTDGSRATMAQTDPGLVVGTVGYMSPEQLRGEAVDARSDVFSLGAVLYEMFTGSRAFKGKTNVDTMSAILKEDPADFPSGLHASSPALERIVRRCLEKNVEERFQSARDVTFALDALSTASGVGSGVIAAPPSARRSRAVAAAAIAAVLLIVAAAYFAGTRFGARPIELPSLTQLTFRNGIVESARFSPDGKTVVYSAAWEGDPITVFSTRPGSPESSALSVPPANVLAISSAGEMALSLNARHATVFITAGTLARASLSGGAPRELTNLVMSADWSGDGRELAAVVAEPPGARLEFPLGTVRVRLPYWMGDARVSPDGTQVAFIAHPGGGDDGDVRVIGRSGDARTISKGWLSIQGLAWAQGGREVWVTGTRVGMLRSLWAITLDGRERLLYRAPVRLTLEDVAPDGRVLLAGMTLRSEMRFGSLEQRTERDISWFDYGTGMSISADAKLIAFSESGEGAGSKYGVFVRPTDGSPAFRIADGGTSWISPDGKWVLVGGMTPTDTSVKLMPTGPGTAREFDGRPLSDVRGGAWMSDSRHFILIGTEKGATRSYDFDTQTGRLTPLTPEGTFGRLISPNGEWLPVLVSGTPRLLNLRTRAAVPPPIQPAAGEEIIGWSEDSQSLFVMQRQQQRLKLFRAAVPAGSRTELATIEPADRAGLVLFGALRVAPDGDHYIYNYFRQLSQLYLVDLAGR